MKNKKSQIALEFIMIAGISVLVLIAFISFTATLSSERLDRDTYIILDDLGKSLQNEFVRATEVRDGYERKIELPQEINGREYSVEIIGIDEYRSEIVFDFQDRTLLYPIPNVEGELEHGENTLLSQGGELFIK